ncbi:MAG: hypothetical protein LUQ38_11165 [Methanotrichaceae archaeon]|nr:hypothetical protein [Methanotrichaceae archaeon]MDD1758571.1 hypothetical protein [Methanotrichaceae archaeon]
MIWSRKCLLGPRVAHDAVNPRMLELEIAKEILDEYCNLPIVPISKKL